MTTVIDLHTHTYPCSPCAHMSAQQLIEAAISRKLDGIVVTDHLWARGGREAQALAQAQYPNFLVLKGVEARTTMGDILVYGVDQNFPEWMDGLECLRTVREAGGVAIVPHPFRGFERGRFQRQVQQFLFPPAPGTPPKPGALWGWLQHQHLGLGHHLATQPQLDFYAAVETFNGGCNPAEIRMAEDLARILGLPATGGSDAHVPQHVGRTATEFAAPITSDADLVVALKSGCFRPWTPH